MYAPKGLQIHVDVERKPVVACTAADANAKTRKLAFGDVHAGSVAATLRRDSKRSCVVDDAFLKRAYQRAHAQARALQVNERIDDELSGPVIGDLATAIDLQHGNVAGREQVGAACVHAEREDRRVLEKPDLIRAFAVTLVGEFLHRTISGLVVCAPQMP